LVSITLSPLIPRIVSTGLPLGPADVLYLLKGLGRPPLMGEMTEVLELTGNSEVQVEQRAEVLVDRNRDKNTNEVPYCF
jgi:hypothetical protein